MSVTRGVKGKDMVPTVAAPPFTSPERAWALWLPSEYSAVPCSTAEQVYPAVVVTVVGLALPCLIITTLIEPVLDPNARIDLSRGA